MLKYVEEIFFLLYFPHTHAHTQKVPSFLVQSIHLVYLNDTGACWKYPVLKIFLPPSLNVCFGPT